MAQKTPRPVKACSPREIEAILKSLGANLGVDIEAAFSDDVFVCKNCGHEYVGERLCPECGA